MKKILTALCLILLLGLWGCGEQTNGTQAATESTAPTEPQPESYADAARAMEDLTDLELKVTVSKVTTVCETSYPQEMTYRIVYNDLGEKTFQARVVSSGSFGRLQRGATEQFRNGVLYLDDTRLGKKGFCSPMTEEEFLNRYYPVVLLDEALYGSVESTVESAPAGYKSVYTFKAPSAPEGWLGENVELISAEGSATVRNGQILSSTYKATYTQGEASMELTVTTEVISHEPESLVSTPSPADYRQIESMEALSLLRQAYDTANATPERSVDMTQSLVLSLAGEQWIWQENHLKLYTFGDQSNYMSLFCEGVPIVDEMGTVVDSGEYIEIIKDGRCYVKYDSGAASTYDDVWVPKAMSYNQGWITGGFVEPGWITAISLEDRGDHLLLHLTGDKKTLGGLGRNLLTVGLQSSEDRETREMLSDLTVESMTATMTLDKMTRLPVAYTVEYGVLFPFELLLEAKQEETDETADAFISMLLNILEQTGGSFTMHLRIDMTMEIPSPDAYQTILDAAEAFED